MGDGLSQSLLIIGASPASDGEQPAVGQHLLGYYARPACQAQRPLACLRHEPQWVKRQSLFHLTRLRLVVSCQAHPLSERVQNNSI